MSNKKSNHWARWIFSGFGGLLVIINAALTFSFGYTYLGRSFGSGMMSDYAGALYAILIFDIAYLAWFYTFLRTAESTGQRSLALGMAGFSLIGSLSATLQQLAINADDLVDLSAYHQTVGLIALFIMLFMTAAHVVSCASYLLMSPQERKRQQAAVLNGRILDDTIETSEKMLELDYRDIVYANALDMRANALEMLGFTSNLTQITASTDDGKYNELIKPTRQAVPVVLQESAPDNTPLVIDDDTANVTPIGNSDENFTSPSSQ